MQGSLGGMKMDKGQVYIYVAFTIHFDPFKSYWKVVS